MSLRVGHITYANCAPFFHHLPETGFGGAIVPGVPAQLNALLAAGRIDVSPSSSFEYLRNWRDYLLLPGLSISSRGPVRSVLLFAPGPMEALDGATITLTGESATSVNLLRILLREYYGHTDCRFRVAEEPIEQALAVGEPTLLIGDRALQAARRPDLRGECHDLGELWYRYTGLPFVFALWILRREVGRQRPEEVRALLAQLQTARATAFAGLEKMAAVSPERRWLPETELVDYWRRMDYDLGEEHLTGLRRYAQLCCKYDLLPEEPRIRFFGGGEEGLPA